MTKVILHYNVTGGAVQTIDQVVNVDQELEITDESGNITKIKAKDAKGFRATLPLDLDELTANVDNKFDSDYVKMGYAWTQKFDPIKGRLIKLPKKEEELRKLFNITDPKTASFWTHDYDNIDINVLGEETEKKKLSFIRGLFSAKARIRPGPKGYISYNWAYLNNELDDDTMDKFLDLFYNLTSATLEHNGSNVFFADRRQLYEYITKIGFVQKLKMKQAIISYRLHLRKINDVIPISKDYLLYHVENFGETNDYNDQLGIDYDVNAIHPKNGRTVLTIATTYAKHNSWYPVLWLLEHGADISIKSKKDPVFKELIINRLNSYDRRNSTGIEYLSKIIGYLYKNPIEYNKNLVTLMFCPNWSDSREMKHLFGLFINGLSYIDPYSICSSIIEIDTKYSTNESIKLDIKKYEEHLILMNSILDSSKEDLDLVMDKLLNKILDVIHGDYNHYLSKANDHFYKELDLYTPFYDSLKKRVEPNKNKLKQIQDKMKKYKTVIYRYGKAEKLL